MTLTPHDEIKPGSVIQKVVAMKTDILQPANMPPTFGLEAPVKFAPRMNQNVDERIYASHFHRTEPLRARTIFVNIDRTNVSPTVIEMWKRLTASILVGGIATSF